MDLGFETCGNATIIVYDRGVPVLVTDPWLKGAQYFGSWRLPYDFTPTHQAAFAQARYVWLSHGHPDHLNLESLESFRNRTLLLPRHYGGRISADLKAAGYRVQDLENRRWLQLSPRVRILTCADWNQDAAVLVALGEQCAVLDLNDGSALGTRLTLKSNLRRFRRRFVLRLFNYGDADMINLFTESGERIPPTPPERKPLGYFYSALLDEWNGTHTAPFSCHHTYARTDSQWATEYETPLGDHGRCFKSTLGEFIPGYFSYEVESDRITQTPIVQRPRRFHEPAEFGDDWSDALDADDVQTLRSYFRKFEHVRRHFRFINARVGGRDHFVDLEGPLEYAPLEYAPLKDTKERGITFEAPRHSLMTAVRCEIFDDLLIGNFAKTTLHGGVKSLYPDFTPYVAKYGDNGRAFSASEIDEYFRTHRRECGFHAWVDQIRVDSARKLRRRVVASLSGSPALYLAARRVYRRYMA